MTERNTCFHKVKPFVDTDLVKVLVGMRRVGKSVLLGQIADYLKELGVPEDHILHYNFEQIQNASFCTTPSVHQEITRRIKAIPSPSEGRRKFYLFFDEIQEVNHAICWQAQKRRNENSACTVTSTTISPNMWSP